MTESKPPRPGRRATDRQPNETSSSSSNLPIPAARPSPQAGAFDAQVIGQGTARRGLRGGKEVLDAARTTYLKTEWSGPADRRPPAGLFAKTKV